MDDTAFRILGDVLKEEKDKYITQIKSLNTELVSCKETIEQLRDALKYVDESLYMDDYGKWRLSLAFDDTIIITAIADANLQLNRNKNGNK